MKGGDRRFGPRHELVDNPVVAEHAPHTGDSHREILQAVLAEVYADRAQRRGHRWSAVGTGDRLDLAEDVGGGETVFVALAGDLSDLEVGGDVSGRAVEGVERIRACELVPRMARLEPGRISSCTVCACARLVRRARAARCRRGEILKTKRAAGLKVEFPDPGEGGDS